VKELEHVVWPDQWDKDDVAAWLKDHSRQLDPYIQGPTMRRLACFIEDTPLYTAPPTQGWQPIDGNTHGYKGQILICDDRGNVSLNHSNWVSDGTAYDGATQKTGPAFLGTLRYGYTKWMPLPAPPTSEVK
jgi:hypothetical protein